MFATSAPGSPRTEQTLEARGELVSEGRRTSHSARPADVAGPPVPKEEGRKTQLPPVSDHSVPDELLVSLTSTFCSRSTAGHTAHHRHCKDWGIRRPDAVWHHPLRRKKYQFFLENSTSSNGAGRDISFLCDATMAQKKTTLLPPLADRTSVGDTQGTSVCEGSMPEEYCIVRNKGLQRLELYEDAFTVQLQDKEQKLRVFPSLKPSGRQEVVQLMRMMDDMLLKAGVDEHTEELTEISQIESLLELVRTEQNIYNIVFHEVIRQVTVSCTERGQLLEKLRKRYQSLFDRVPRILKALHTESVAQRALNRRMAEEIYHNQSSIQQLSVQLSRILESNAVASQEADRAHHQLTVALQQASTNSDVVQGYHELYELQRSRLEAQLLQMTEQRDNWKERTLGLALKMIGMKKLQLFTQLHLSEQSWTRTAEHCSIYLSSKDTECLNTVAALTDQWKEQLTAFMSQLKKTEHAQREELDAIRQGIVKWLNFIGTQKKCPNPQYEKAVVEKIFQDFQEWYNTLALQCENYQGEKLLCCQLSLDQLTKLQDGWLSVSLQLLGRCGSPDGETHEGQRAAEELGRVLPEFLKRLGTQVAGETGIHGQMIALLELTESWISKVAAAVSHPEMMSISDWLELEQALHKCLSLVEKALQTVFCVQTEKPDDKIKPDMYAETEDMLKKVEKFICSLSNFADSENQRLSDEITAVNMAQTRWMVDLLLLMVPDHNEDQNQEQDCQQRTNTSQQTLDEDAKMLAEKLGRISKFLTRSCKLILEEQNLQYALDAEGENEMNECRKLQVLCTDWMEACMILLAGLRNSPIRRPDASPSSDAPVPPVSPAADMETLVNKESSGRQTADGQLKDETDTEPQESFSKDRERLPQGELPACDNIVVKLIGYDGNITEKKLGQSTVRLPWTEELVVFPGTDEAQKAFDDLTTVGLLQQELHNSELQLQSAVQRALKAEEDLQAALGKIQDLERQLQSQSRVEPQRAEEQKNTAASPPPATPSAPPEKSAAETHPKSGTRRTKKR